MARGFNGVLMRHLGAKDHVTRVISAEMITPHMKRIRFHAPTAFDDIIVTPATYVRGWFEADDGKEHQRGYTLIEIDEDAREYSIDFLIHEPSGPAGNWAARAKEGDELVVSPFGVRLFAVPTPAPAGYLLVADAAGIPAVRELVAEIGDIIPIEIYLGVEHDDDRSIPVPQQANVRVHWVDVTDDDSLARAIENRDWSQWKAYLIPESGMLRPVKKRLQDEFGFPRSEIGGQAYWKRGKQMGTSRDLTPEEDREPTPGTRQALPEIDALPHSNKRPESREASSPNHTDTTEDSSVAASTNSAQTTRGEWVTHRGGQLLRPVKPALIIAGIVQFIATVLELAPFVVLVEGARQLLSGGTLAEMMHLGIVFLILFGVGTGLSTLLIIVMHVIDARFSQDIRMRLLKQLAVVPLAWFDSKPRAHTKRVVGDDTLALHYLVTHAVSDAVAAITAPVLVLVYLFTVDWRIALALLVPVLIALFLMYTMVFRSYDSVVQAPVRAEKIEAAATAFVDAQPVVAVFPHTRRFYESELDDYVGFLKGWQIPFDSLKTAMTLVTRPTTLLLTIAWAATPLVLTGSVQIGDVLPFIFLGTTFATRLLAIGYQLQGLRDGLAASHRVAEVIHTPPLPTPDKTDQPARDGSLTLTDVSFSYHPGTDVLKDVSLTIPAGSTCALVGHSGAGKSTLAHLLARFADPTTGSIHLGGRDLRSFATDDLYSEIGFVFQDIELINASIHDNIALARPDATRAEVIEAATAAHIHERIMRLDDGYDSMVTSQTGLSGGELQRISIARLLLANPRVLILDEATAFADPQSHAAVQKALTEVTQGRTVVTIAHRLSTITASDLIVVLEDGRIVEKGTHDDLLGKRGHYFNLWEARA